MPTSWTGVVTIPIRTYQAEGKEDPGYNGPRGPIVGLLVVVRLVSVDGFRDRLMSSPSDLGCREEVRCKSASDYRRWR